MRPILGILVIPGAAFATGCFSARPSAPDSFVCQAFRNAVEAPIRDTDECHFLKRTENRPSRRGSNFATVAPFASRIPSTMASWKGLSITSMREGAVNRLTSRPSDIV